MKKYNLLSIRLVWVALIGLLISCEVEDDFEKYEPEVISSDGNTLTYNPLSTFPIPGEIVSDAPTLLFEGKHSYVLDTIKASAGASLSAADFTIDRNTGEVSFTTAGEETAANYQVSIGVSTIEGVMVFEDALSIEVKDVPISITIDNVSVDVGPLALGPIATVSLEDNSDGDITTVEYALANNVQGFSIDATTGVISKTATVVEPTVAISVKAITNIGAKTFTDVLTVNIGAAPTLNYVQADGLTDLTGVTVSPWTAYTTAIPNLVGMQSGGGYQIILPVELDPYSGFFSVGADGRMSIAADAGLPNGTFPIGMIVTNAGGASATFEDLFTITVESRWEAVPFIDEDFEDPSTGDPETAYPGVWSNHVFSGSGDTGWAKIFQTLAGSFSGFRRFNPKDTDAGLVRTVDLTGVKGLRVSFTELVGYGGAFLSNYERGFYYGEEISSAQAGNFVEAEWNAILDLDDSGWLGVNWGGGNGPPQAYSQLEVDLSNVSGNTLYLMWRLKPTATSSLDQNGQYVIESFQAERVSAFAAEEN